ncbi:hypothetical protein L1987_31542 [Smallanthus sonchifolius]|uniref:Uncharacterized protein n=1 Tax=Smallanthus sonchifolius TaxID=185202 RepID=A0ACB9I6L4_9ASTR|nr:hypothetical protein L1987_31542 [Smallanthus sonchifolius]
MAARAHDVAALSIKGNSAVLNFPQLKHLLPRPESVSPCDVQAAAAKAATMQELGWDCYSSTPPPAADGYVFPVDEHAGDELGEIIELPSLEGLESPDSLTKLMVDGWLCSSWAVADVDGFPAELSDEVTKDSR